MSKSLLMSYFCYFPTHGKGYVHSPSFKTRDSSNFFGFQDFTLKFKMLVSLACNIFSNKALDSHEDLFATYCKLHKCYQF